MGAYERVNTAGAVAGGPYTGDEGSPVTLDGSASKDDGSLASYAWDCTDDGSADAASASPTGNSCTYPDDGSYTLRLTTTDNLGATGTNTTPVAIANVVPVLTPPSNQAADAGAAKSFAVGSFTDPGAEDTWQVTVKWGDGTADTPFDASGAGNLAEQPHTYAAAGTYDVAVTVSDGEAQDDGGFQVNVSPGAGQTGAVTGVIFDDANGNGVQDQGEPGIPGVEVKLIDQAAAANVALARTTLTDGDGRYQFDNVPPGDYTVVAGAAQQNVSVSAGKTTTVPVLNVEPGGDKLYLPALQR